MRQVASAQCSVKLLVNTFVCCFFPFFLHLKSLDLVKSIIHQRIISWDVAWNTNGKLISLLILVLCLWFSAYASTIICYKHYTETGGQAIHHTQELIKIMETIDLCLVRSSILCVFYGIFFYFSINSFSDKLCHPTGFKSASQIKINWSKKNTLKHYFSLYFGLKMNV